jgi:hypothetical protein
MLFCSAGEALAISIPRTEAGVGACLLCPPATTRWLCAVPTGSELALGD